MEITSVNNELVKEAAKLQQKKYRSESGKFLLEGYKAIFEAYNCGIKLERVFVENKHLPDYEFVKDIVISVTEPVLKKIATTDSAPEAVGVGYQKQYDKNVFKNFKKVILLEDVKDLGNLGTIIRSAVAFGADGIVLFGESADIYNPKCVRATVGNLWKLPIIHIESVSELNKIFAKFERVATLPRTDNLLKSFKLNLPSLVMFGSEANGLSQELIDFSSSSVKIEMNKQVESLNLATSVSIIMYELF